MVDDVVVPPMIDNRVPDLKQPLPQEAAEQAAMLADMAKRREEEAAIAKVQDAALNAVREACDRERDILREKENAK